MMKIAETFGNILFCYIRCSRT